MQENYELDTYEIKDSPFDNSFKWNFNEERKEVNNMNYEKIVNIVVDKIEQLPSGSEKSIAELIGEDIKSYNITDLFNINEQVIKKCKEKNIKLSYEKYENKEVGLPFNTPFIKE